MAFPKLKFSLCLPVVAGLVLVFGLVLTAVFSQQHITQVKAAESQLAAGTKCTNGPADIMLIIDKSGSMGFSAGSTTRLAKAKTAAVNFVNIVKKNTNNRIALVTFSTSATLDSGFTNNYSSIITKINAIKPVSHTCTQCGVKKANAEIVAHSRKDLNGVPVKKIVVLLTDGRANWVEGSTKEVYTPSIVETPVLNLVTSIYNSHKVTYYTIGLGNAKDINATFLQNIAAITPGGHYYPSPTADQLNTIYTQISATVGTGSIAGFVFEDINGNGAYDSGEKKLPDWTIQLFSGSGTTPIATTISDKDGNYKFMGLCDGSYKVKEVVKTGWTQTLPKNPDYYPVTITNNAQITGKNFGNKPDRDITLSLDLLLHGIGKAGDVPNPGPSGGGNENPKHPDREVIIDLFNTKNQKITKKGTLKYASASGSFKGDVNVGTLSSGSYIVKVKLSQSLTKQIGNVQNFPTGTTSALPQISLINGDINNDNKVSLTIEDYNILLGCFSNYLPPKSCSSSQKIQADLDDDGDIDQFDFNLFVREISHIVGS